MPSTPPHTRDAAPIVQVHDLSMHYEDRSALRDVDVSIYPGETLGLLGPNGAGKSTLLKIIAGMLPPSHGRVTLRGEEITGAMSCITYVPQRSDADWSFPISVLDATLLGLAPFRSRWKPFGSKDRELAMNALKQVRMADLASAQIGALSGGQQQRVFLARALLACGDVLLLDEPFTGVDVPTQEMLVAIFDELRRHGTAIVYATHDLQQAARTSDRVLLLNGDVIAYGPPSEALNHDSLQRTYGGQVVVLNSPVPAAAPAMEAGVR
jgi:ABC-type Mn2+/Zn2+ transport system ATPase subunit